MSYLVTGTRERFYPARTPAEVSDQEEQEAEAHAHGWVPLTSEREADGTLRVLYGRLAGAPDGEAAGRDQPVAGDGVEVPLVGAQRAVEPDGVVEAERHQAAVGWDVAAPGVDFAGALAKVKKASIHLSEYADETSQNFAYGSEPRHVEGVGHCDRNMYNGDVASLNRWWKNGGRG